MFFEITQAITLSVNFLLFGNDHCLHETQTIPAECRRA